MVKITQEPLPEADLFPYCASFRCWSCGVGFQLEPGDGHAWARTAHATGAFEFAVTRCPNDRCEATNLLPKVSSDVGWAASRFTPEMALGIQSASVAARAARPPRAERPAFAPRAPDRDPGDDLGGAPALDDDDPQPARPPRKRANLAYEDTIQPQDWGDGVRVRR